MDRTPPGAPTAVKVEGRTSWTHTSHCRKVTPLETEVQRGRPVPLTDEEEK